MKPGRSGFTLVEIMIVVAIVALLAVIAIPSFSKSRRNARMSACINNLRLIDQAKEQWATSNGRSTGDMPANTDIDAYLRASPTCPGGGVYTYNAVGTLPVCSLAASPDLHVISY